jgi:hypothetical protein
VLRPLSVFDYDDGHHTGMQRCASVLWPCFVGVYFQLVSAVQGEGALRLIVCMICPVHHIGMQRCAFCGLVQYALGELLDGVGRLTGEGIHA